jgi:DNA polymerase III epsilon subunit-like protein
VSKRIYDAAGKHQGNKILIRALGNDMFGFEWTLVDTETTGLESPIHVVELAAQRMVDWEPNGTPFRMFLNHKVDIPEGARKIHGYTREFLAAKGVEPRAAHQAFDRYAEKTPIVSYNLPYDYDKVLVPEWGRLGHRPSQCRGFCVLRLARKIIEPQCVSNYKLQTLREYYSLPERGAHSALGDIRTVANLLSSVLRPEAKKLGLTLLRDVQDFVNARSVTAKVSRSEM